MPNVKFIRDTLYILKKNYGVEISYLVVKRSDVNLDTGLATVQKQSYTIKKAIQLPSKLQRQFVQDIAYLAANKNFTYGALFDSTKTIFLIDRRDLPRDVDINMNNYFIVNHKRFVIDSAEILEHNCGWLVIVKNHEGASPFEIHQLSIRSTLDFQHIVKDVLNG